MQQKGGINKLKVSPRLLEPQLTSEACDEKQAVSGGTESAQTHQPGGNNAHLLFTASPPPPCAVDWA